MTKESDGKDSVVYYYCIKFALSAYSTLFSIIGLVILCIGIYAEVERQKHRTLEGIFLAPAVLLLLLGITMFAVSFIGMVGSLRDNRTLLKMFFWVLLVIFIMEMLLIFIEIIFEQQMNAVFHSNIQEGIRHYYDDLDFKNILDFVQEKVVHAINDVLLPRIIRLRDVDETMAGFAALGFPNCGGALDATHIAIRAPEHRAAHFMNRKGYCSIVLQALVDHRGRFLDIYGGWSGRAHDARILRNSGLFQRLEAGTYFPRRDLTVGDVPMPICIIGDAAYPLMPWLMRPYTGQPDQNRARFNDRLNRARNPVELAFGRLKGRFRCLLTRLDMGEQNATEVLAACCVLHNIVERSGEAFLPAWVAAEAQTLDQPATAAIRQARQEAVRIREALVEMFAQAP